MKKVLIFTKYFKPAFKAGGPIKSIDNILKIYGNKYDITLVTGDSDIDNIVYKNIILDETINKKNYKIKYLSKRKNNYYNLFKIIHSIDPDTLYLNSFFDYNFSIKIAILNKFYFKKKMIISPRGELYKNALAIKKIKKKFFLFLSNFFQIYKGVIFQVNSIKEKKELSKINFLRYLHSTVVPVLYPKLKEVKIDELSLNRKNFKILYVSRIVKNKNLDFCLKILKKLNLKVNFIIIGPIEDKKYWLMCKKKILDIKKKVKIDYLGYQKKDKINKIMKNSHCFFLPSMFESFGHVIFESFLNGLPVVTSKNTPWNKLKSKKIGADIDIANEDIYVSELKSLMTCDEKNYRSIRVNTLRYSKKIINQNIIYKNKDIF